MREVIKLPNPVDESSGLLSQILWNRKSRRRFNRDANISLETFSQILWAAAGRNKHGGRVFPSAGACYPVEMYVAVGKGRVNGVEAGVYRYLWTTHELRLHRGNDVLQALASACLDQMFMANAAFIIIFSVIPERTTGRYGKRGFRYIYMDLGHAGQNVYLQAESLGLGTVGIGAFHDDEVARVLNLPEGECPSYLFPVGPL